VVGRIPITVITFQCGSTCFLSVMIMMSEQVVPSAVTQRIIVKFLINENVKPAGNLTKLRAQFDYKTLSRTQVYD